MRLALLLALLLSGAASAQDVCGPSAAKRLPTVRVGGNSLTLNVCVSGGTGPITTLDTNLSGGLAGGWLVKNAGVSNTTPAQIRAAYESTTPGGTGESVACNGERCRHLILEGGVNCLRTGGLPATCLADMTVIVDDALSKGVAVVWLDVTPYAGYVSAGVNPRQQALDFNTAWALECTKQTCAGIGCIPRGQNPLLVCLANYATFEDPASPGALLPALSCDFLHFSQVGMNLYSSRIQSALLGIP